MLTQRSVDAQQFGADSVNATVEKARAAAKQATDTLRRTEPLLKEGFVSAEDVDRARTAQRAAEADLNAVLLQAQSAASAVSGVDALVAQRAAVEADIALTKLHLEMATVRAPFDGRVISLKTSVGQFASAMRPIFYPNRHSSLVRDRQLPRNRSEKYSLRYTRNDSPDE